MYDEPFAGTTHCHGVVLKLIRQLKRLPGLTAFSGVHDVPESLSIVTTPVHLLMAR